MALLDLNAVSYSTYHLYVEMMSCMSLTQGGYTPLISAARQGHCDVVIDLLSLGVDVNGQTNVSHHPHWICS